MKRRYQIARWLGHQHWLRGRGPLVSLLCPRDLRSEAEFNVEFFGHRYQGLLDDFIDRHVYLFGGWELHVLALMSQVARAFRTVGRKSVTYVDVGANTGQHALFMSRHVDTVICFEPFEPVRRRLEEKVALNRLGNVFVVPIALSGKEGTSSYYSPEGQNQGTGSLVQAFSAGNRTAPIDVRTNVGDSYFQDRSQPPISIVKIDVEGGERGVLEGLRETLLRSRPAVILELSEYTRADIGSLAKLRGLLYPGAAVLTIGQAKGRLGYRLQECDFKAPSDLLIVPSEFSAAIPIRESFCSVPAHALRLLDHHKAGRFRERSLDYTPDGSSRRIAADSQSPMGKWRSTNPL